MIRKRKKSYKFLNLLGLSIESFSAIWLSLYEFLVKKVCTRNTVVCVFFLETCLPGVSVSTYSSTEMDWHGVGHVVCNLNRNRAL